MWNTPKRSLALAALGNIFEYYDFMLYSMFVSILSPLFFPNTDPMISLLSGFVVFAMGFLARPMGAILFGYMGDKLGRKRALSASLFLMALSTCAMGFLPTYNEVGYTAAIVLTVLRMFQGLAAGGEVNGAGIYAVEQAPQERKGFYGALLISSAGIGALMATGVGALFTNSIFNPEGWRFPFILGGGLAFIAVYFRRHLHESHEFSEAQTTSTFPLKQVLTEHPLSFLRALTVGGFIHVPFYVLVGFINPVLNTQNLITSTEMMLINMGLILFGISIIPYMGRLADLYTPARIMRWSTFFVALLALPLFMAIATQNLTYIIVAQLLFLGVAEGFIGASNAFLNSLFPPHLRYSGVAVGSTIGTALLAGMTPLACTKLSLWIDPLWGPVAYVTCAALVGYLGVSQKSHTRVAKSA